jgi:hypothetical protein
MNLQDKPQRRAQRTAQKQAAVILLNKEGIARTSHLLQSFLLSLA